MVLLKDRLEALGGYLRQCEKESDFGSLRQQQYELIHKSLTEQLVKVTFTEAGQYVQLLQAMPWTDEQRKALLSVVQGKLLNSEQQTPAAGRLPMQDFTAFPRYLRDEDWKRITDASLASQALSLTLKEIMEHLGRLTLRAPEETCALLTVLLLRHDPARVADPETLRSAYLAVKSQCKFFLTNIKKSDLLGSMVRVLPADPAGLDSSLHRAVFGEGHPAAIPPEIDVDSLHQQRALVKMRSFVSYIFFFGCFENHVFHYKSVALEYGPVFCLWKHHDILKRVSGDDHLRSERFSAICAIRSSDDSAGHGHGFPYGSKTYGCHGLLAALCFARFCWSHDWSSSRGCDSLLASPWARKWFRRSCQSRPASFARHRACSSSSSPWTSAGACHSEDSTVGAACASARKNTSAGDSCK